MVDADIFLQIVDIFLQRVDIFLQKVYNIYVDT